MAGRTRSAGIPTKTGEVLAELTDQNAETDEANDRIEAGAEQQESFQQLEMGCCGQAHRSEVPVIVLRLGFGSHVLLPDGVDLCWSVIQGKLMEGHTRPSFPCSAGV